MDDTHKTESQVAEDHGAAEKPVTIYKTRYDGSLAAADGTPLAEDAEPIVYAEQINGFIKQVKPDGPAK